MGTLGVIVVIGVVLFGIYFFLLPKKPFEYGGHTTDQADVNRMRNQGAGFLLLVFIVFALALLGDM